MRYVRVFLFSIILGVALFALSRPRDASASSDQQADQKCRYLTDALSIPDDGSWLQICVIDPSAPEGLSVTEMNLKVVVEHPDPSQLEIRLTRVGSELVLVMPSDTITKEGVGKLAAIHDFDGQPSQGEWMIQIRDMVPGTAGIVKSVSIAPYYASVGKMAQSHSEYDGKPTSERVAAGAVRISGDARNDEKKETGAKNGISDLPQMQLDASGYSVPIMSETFEGVFPPTQWSVFDANPNDGKQYYWDDNDYKSSGGSWAAWPANGGADCVDPDPNASLPADGCLTRSATYPSNMDTWMIYGPFDLSNAKSADVAFMLWRHIEVTYDHVFFGISGDNVNYSGWSWDGSADWESKTYSLNSYIGDNSVWIGWHFTSDGSVQYEGPWIDDINLKFEPGDVTIQGNFTYADRSTTMRGAVGTKVQLWDSDSSGNDLMAETTITDSSGHFSFPAQMNWDLDDTDPNLSNRRLDLYLVWVLENSNYKVTNSNVVPYTWGSSTYNNIGMGTTTISGSLPVGTQNLQAMWIFQDIRRAREYYLNNTSPQSDPQFIAAHWAANQSSEDFIEGSHFWAAIDPHVFIADGSTRSPDTIVHEIGHHIMWNKTGQWLWYEYNCFQHDIFSQESVQCAWSEGWADFFAIAVNGDVCYDKGDGPCTGVADWDKYDLENHTRNDPLNDPNTGLSWWGDGVEGRVAGSLYDLMDSGNEAPWYDNASWGFSPIVDIALTGSGKSSLHEFWNGYQGSDKHNGIRSIYQNTIDYDQAPVFAAIPEQNTLQNFPHSHIIDLWDYSSDLESPDASLVYQIVSVSDSRCGVSLDSHWVNTNPQMNWTGSCYVTVSVNDTIPNKTATVGFWLHILQINSRNYMPVIMNQ